MATASITQTIASHLLSNHDGPAAIKLLMNIPTNTADDSLQARAAALLTRASAVRKAVLQDDSLRCPSYLPELERLAATADTRADARKIEQHAALPLERQERMRRAIKLTDRVLQEQVRRLKPMPQWFYSFEMPVEVAEASVAQRQAALTNTRCNTTPFSREEVIGYVRAATLTLERLPTVILELNQRAAMRKGSWTPRRHEWLSTVYQAAVALQLVTGRRPTEILDPRGQVVIEPCPGNDRLMNVRGLYKTLCHADDHTMHTVPLLCSYDTVVSALQLVRTTMWPGTEERVLRDDPQLRKKAAIKMFGDKVAKYDLLRGIYCHIAHALAAEIGWMPSAPIELFAKMALGHSSENISSVYTGIRILGINYQPLSLV
jgi:hypothetical protein